MSFTSRTVFAASATCALAVALSGASGRPIAAAGAQTFDVTPQPVDASYAPVAPVRRTAPAIRKPVATAPSGSAASIPVSHTGAAVPAAPPNGTYVYAISRDGTDQGKSTVVIFRRAATATIEVDEAAAFGAFRAHLVTGYAYRSLVPNTSIATYQAPFPPGSLLGTTSRVRPFIAEGEQTTVRYDWTDAGAPLALIDGVQGVLHWPLPAPDTRSSLTGLGPESAPEVQAPAGDAPKTGSFVLDGPLMSGWAMFPAWLRKTSATAITPVGAAFPEYAQNVRVARIALPAHQKKTPRTAIAKRIGDFATVWYDPQSQIVYELHLDTLNLDVRLLSYSKITATAPFEPVPQSSNTPKPDSTELNISLDAGASLSGTLGFPAKVKKAPAIVLVAPPAGDSLPLRDYYGDPHRSMFDSMADAFLKRGYAVARYDARGVGKSGGNYGDLTWQSSLEDLGAVVGDVESNDAVDGSRVFVAGYLTGADLAFAAAAQPDNKLAGVIALDPTLVSYHEALHRRYLAAAQSPDDKAKAERAFQHELRRLGKPDAAGPESAPLSEATPQPSNNGVWYKSALAHDPSMLAARITLPAFVLHSSSTDPARTADDVRTFDDRLRAADSLANIVVASDLSDHFGGRYDADAPGDTRAIFPYAFDTSTAGALADWLDTIHSGEHASGGSVPARTPRPSAAKTPPAPPPLPAGAHPSTSDGLPVRRKPIDDVDPGSVGTPSTLLASPPPTATPVPTQPPTPTPTTAPPATAPPTQSPPAPRG